MIGLEAIQVIIGGAVKLDVPELTIADDEHVAVCGPSGAGKSLLVECIAGVRMPDRGVVRFGGDDVTRLGPWDRQCGWVPQSRGLFPHMSVRDNMAFGARLHPERVDTLADSLGLRELLDKSPLVLSGGERSRVALARALAPEPKYLVLDEPFTALDKANRDRAWELVHQAHGARKFTILHVTHDEDRARQDGLRVIHVDGGRIG